MFAELAGEEETRSFAMFRMTRKRNAGRHEALPYATEEAYGVSGTVFSTPD